VPGAQRDDSALVVRDLVKRYGERLALAGLDLVVPRAAVTALLGPNGAGKTTTVEICCGLRAADAGEVRVLGLDPVRDGAALRPRLGLMLQTGGIPNGTTAPEIMRHFARLHANPLDPDALLHRLGLHQLGRTTYRRMSGGQKQLLALGLAVIGRPELVFLDEPTAGLDPHARRDTWGLIRSLRADGVSVVLATHLMDEAEALADLVHIIDRGKLVASGSPGELTRGHSGVLTFLAPPALPLAALAAVLPAGCTAVEYGPGEYRVSGRVGPAELAAVTAWCAQLNVMPDIVNSGRRRLEDVFLELTRASQ